MRVARDAASAAAVIETQALGKVYAEGSEAEVVALRDVDLRIGRGEFVAIMGPSGSGKSTLMNLLGCLDTPSSGTYWCDGVDVATLDAEELRAPAPGQDRLRLPGLQPAAADGRAGERRDADGLRATCHRDERLQARARGAGGGRPGQSRSTIGRARCPAASSSASRSRAR